jgi:hypothetical protein
VQQPGSVQITGADGAPPPTCNVIDMGARDRMPKSIDPGVPAGARLVLDGASYQSYGRIQGVGSARNDRSLSG